MTREVEVPMAIVTLVGRLMVENQILRDQLAELQPTKGKEGAPDA